MLASRQTGGLRLLDRHDSVVPSTNLYSDVQSAWYGVSHEAIRPAKPALNG